MSKASTDWKPQFKLDLRVCSPSAFQILIEEFKMWAGEQTPGLSLATGWHQVTPQIAEQLLMRNASNRKVSLSTARYYSEQMSDNDWVRTGQPLLIDAEGKLQDGQHRLWASYLGGASFPTFVVADVPVQPQMFAYIDNSKPRSIKDAIDTAGIGNGVVHRAIKLAVKYEHNAWGNGGRKIERIRIPRMSPIQAIHYVKRHPNLEEGARLMEGEYRAAAEVIGHKDVAAFAAYKILDLFGEEALDDFMLGLGSDSDGRSAIKALQAAMDLDVKSREPMSNVEVLAHVIKAFNAFITNLPIKRLGFRVNEPFPKFVGTRENYEE